MADTELPTWINKPASEASAAERQAFVNLGKADSNLPAMKAVLERDPGWAAVKSEYVRAAFVALCGVCSSLYGVYSSLCFPVGRNGPALGRRQKCCSCGGAPSPIRR